jgi:uncharacterized protein (TIGR03067 family)
VKKNLPHRPDLDHLRREAKALLAALQRDDPEAVSTFRLHLPEAKGMTAERVRRAGFRLADAQSAVARKTGFESWPRLARHVEQLRALEGVWAFDRLEVEGSAVPAPDISSSRLLIDGDLFRMESPEGTYEGVFNIDVEEQPHHLDIEFVAGPEAGNWNYAIFQLEKDRLEICLNMRGGVHPNAFATSYGSGLAYEVLRRDSRARPKGVTGGSRGQAGEHESSSIEAEPTAFAHEPSETLGRLQGEWAAEKIFRDGQELPAFMLKTARRVAKENEVTVTVGGAVVVQALVRIDESATPIHIDYFGMAGSAKGAIQRGIMEWRGDTAWFCMGAPGDERPRAFECPAGSGTTLSAWKKQA